MVGRRCAGADRWPGRSPALPDCAAPSAAPPQRPRRSAALPTAPASRRTPHASRFTRRPPARQRVECGSLLPLSAPGQTARLVVSSDNRPLLCPRGHGLPGRCRRQLAAPWSAGVRAGLGRTHPGRTRKPESAPQQSRGAKPVRDRRSTGYHRPPCRSAGVRAGLGRPQARERWATRTQPTLAVAGALKLFERRRQQAPPPAVLPPYCRDPDRRKLRECCGWFENSNAPGRGRPA
jgi:hypothetical protein